MPIKDVHKIVTGIEDKIKAKIIEVDEILIHAEPG